jgi:hypothetical protein
MIRGLVQIVGLCLLCGCGNSGGGPLIPLNAPPVTYADYCTEFASIACAAVKNCGCLADIPGILSYCPTYAKNECDSEIKPGVESGAMRYDPVNGGRCIAAIRAIVSDCKVSDGKLNDEITLYLKSCNKVTVGQRTAGQSCKSDEECVDDGMDCRSSVCVTPPTSGQRCLDGNNCAKDLFCTAEKICQPLRGAGGACTEGSRACKDNLYCDSRSKTCQPPITHDQVCGHATNECADGLYCATSTKTCQPYPAAGQSCASSGKTCAADAWCDASSVCQKRKTLGSACSDDDECQSDECENDQCVADDDNLCRYIF